jgi:hypothetical protein
VFTPCLVATVQKDISKEVALPRSIGSLTKDVDVPCIYRVDPTDTDEDCLVHHLMRPHPHCMPAALIFVQAVNI